MRPLTLLLCLLAARAGAVGPQRVHPAAGRVIATITIDSRNVFDPTIPSEDKLLYRMADSIHIKTFGAVIQRELLFEVGDVYDPLLIEETERNLRALGFIRRAEITGTINKEGTADVVVRTYDSWTLQVVASFKRAGGVTNIKAGLAELNILGQGKAVSGVYSRDGGTPSQSFNYKDVQFLHYKRLQYSMVAISSPGNENYSMSLIRPFYASIAKQSAGTTVGYTSSPDSTGAKRREGTLGATYGVALATSTERTRRVNFGILTDRARSDGPVTNATQETYLQLGAEIQELDFLTVRRIQDFTHDEDYNLGFGILPSVSWAPRLRVVGSGQSQVVPALAVTKGYTWSDQLLLLKSGIASRYVNGANGNRIASLDAQYYLRGFRFQTLALHSGVDLGWRLDSAHQLTLGEITGLRGYGLNEFTGERRFLFNAEDRIYVWDDLYKLLDVGAVVFFDSGYVWPVAAAPRVQDLHNSVGIGLRMAPSRSGSNSPVRIDMAFPLSHHSNHSMWSLSILAGQAF